MTDTNAPGQRPITPARRTLLIGLGTTGASVCGQILDQMDWTYGNLSNVPWIKCVVLETMELSSAMKQLTRSAQFVRLGIDREQYRGITSNPELYDRQMGFSTWNNPDLTSTQDAIIHGANNIRMLGRLAMLFPPNYERAKKAILTALNDLKVLDEKRAGQMYSRGQTTPTDIAFSPGIDIYVTGTLCGGTSSGCFLDMGYLLQSLPGYESQVKTTGIFLLPSGAHGNPKHCANAYAALIELNHYSSNSTRYEQQFPDFLCRKEPGTSPYNYTYLIQARGASGLDYAKLVTAAADYIAADLVGDKTSARDATRTNIADYFSHTDLWGATQKFFSFGLGCIEFPHSKVAKACALRLARRGYLLLSGGTPFTQTHLNQLMLNVPALRVGEMIKQLIALPSAGLDSVIDRALEGARAQALVAEEPLQIVRSQIELAFDARGRSGAHAQLTPGIVPLTVEANENILRKKLRSELIEALRKVLLDPGGGVVSLLNCVELLEKQLYSNIKEGDSVPKDEMATALMHANQAEENARTCRRDFFLFATAGRGRAVERYIDECLASCKNHYRLRLREVCAPAMNRLYRSTLDFVTALHRRLDNADCGMQQELARIVERMDVLFDETNVPFGNRSDGTARVINGVELFDPETTVDMEYQRCLRASGSARGIAGDLGVVEPILAREATLPYAEEAADALFAESHDQKRFDADGFRKLPDWDDYQVMEFANRARTAFRALNDITLMSRIMSLPNRDQELANANQASELFLHWNQGHPRHRSYENTHYKFVFVNNDDPRSFGFNEWITQNGVLSDEKDIRFISDRHQMLIQHERGAFSLGTIIELDEDRTSTWYQHYHDTTIASFHARNDVKEWVIWRRSDDEARTRLRNLYLVGIAVEVIESHGTRFVLKYPPQDMADTGRVELSIDIDLSCQTLKFKNLEGELGTRIAEYRYQNRAVGVFYKIDEMIKRSGNLFREEGKLLSMEELHAYLLDYIMDDSELTAEYRTIYPNRSEARLVGTDKNGQACYVCPCEKQHVVGYHAKDLYVISTKEGKRLREFKCAICKKDFLPILTSKTTVTVDPNAAQTHVGV